MERAAGAIRVFGNPAALRDFERAFATLSAVPCDILVTPHPEASDLWGRLARRGQGDAPDAMIDHSACRQYAERARDRLRARVTTEEKQAR